MKSTVLLSFNSICRYDVRTYEDMKPGEIRALYCHYHHEYEHKVCFSRESNTGQITTCIKDAVDPLTHGIGWRKRSAPVRYLTPKII